MHKLWATISKDLKILLRDKVGLTLMFVMPISLVLVITSIQNSTFELVNDNKVKMLLCNRDKGLVGKELLEAIAKIGMFELYSMDNIKEEKHIQEQMKKHDALIALVIPEIYSETIISQSKNIASKALTGLGMATIDSVGQEMAPNHLNIKMYYHPVLQESYRGSIQGALTSATKGIESKQVLTQLYVLLGQKQPQNNGAMASSSSQIIAIPTLSDGSRTIPNATEHNIPAWTIFAMFFIVISLGSSVVKEKQNGSFIRLKTMPTNFLLAIISKKLIYLMVAMVQVAVIFSLGIWLFPYLSLPVLRLPSDIAGLVIVSLASGLCAVSYAMVIGVFAETQEQANGFGAVSVVILAALGGILIPSFAMPNSFAWALKISPLHWALESYYDLFLERGKLQDVLLNLVPLLFIIILFQLIIVMALKRKKLI